MPKISNAKLRARRRGIVAAAARCLQRSGVEGTGMRDLFRAANLSPGAVYSYFASKEDLLAAVAAAGPSLVEALLAATEGLAPPRRRLEALLREAAAGAAPARLQLELETAALRSPPIAAALAERRRAARRALAAALGELRGSDGEDPTGLLLILCESIARRRLLEPDADPAPAVAAAARVAGRLLEEE